MNLKKLLTIFVMFLIISIPLSYADIPGGLLEITRSSGNANVAGIFDGNSDNWNIEVRASLGGEEVRPNYLQARFSRSMLPFDSCSVIAAPFYSCSLKFPASAASFPENELSLPITLTHPVTGAAEDEIARISIDAHAPVVTIHSISQQGFDSLIDYTVKDGGSRVCSISKIEFLDGNTKVLELSKNITNCNSYRNQTLLHITDVGTALKSVRVVAYDKIGHAGDAASNAFSLDHTPPDIDVNSFMFSAVGQLQYVPGGSVTTTILINITEEQTTAGAAEEPLEVTADFSSLGLSSAEPADGCDLVDAVSGLYTCRWSRPVTIPQAFSVTIVAEDNNQISSTRAISKNYMVDDTPPVVEYLGSNESQDYIVIGSNVLRASFRETQSGINPNDVALDYTGINPAGSVNKKADECVQDGDFWRCYWSVSATRAGSITLVQAKDIANNFAADLPTVALSIDSAPPSTNVNNIEILSLGGVQTGPVPYLQEGSYIEITATATDISGVKAKANFVQVVSNLGSVEGSCSLTDSNTNEWTCTWSNIGPLISVAATTNKNIEFDFQDFVGNKITPKLSKSVQILDTGVAEPNPDYWRSSAGSALPSELDRQLVDLAYPSVFVPVSLAPVTAALASAKWPLYVQDVTCSAGSEYLHPAYPPEIFNYNPSLPLTTSALPYTFYIKLKLKTAPPAALDTVNINCSFNIMSLINRRVIPNPERESVILPVTFYNNPLGTIDAAVQNEINEIKDEWLVKADVLDVLADLLYWSEIWCETNRIIYEIKGMFAVFKDGLAICCEVPYTAAFCCPNAEIAGKATKTLDSTQEATYMWSDKYCKIINCQLARTDALGQTTRNDWDRWVRFAADNSGQPRNYWSSLEPKNSLVLSTIFLCPTGIVYNLEKARQIECKYAYCLQQSASGMPVDLCVTQRSYSLCMWVWNEIFNFIPFADMIDEFLGNIGDMLDQGWLGLLNVGTRITCHYICEDPGNPGCTVCMAIAWADWLAETLCDLGVGDNCEPYWETLDPIPENYCELLEE